MNSYKKSIMAVLMAFSLVAPAAHAVPVEDGAIAAGVALAGYGLTRKELNKENLTAMITGFIAGAFYSASVQRKDYPLLMATLVGATLAKIFYYNLYVQGWYGNEQAREEVLQRLYNYDLAGSLMGICADAALNG